jgi:hypothetical protein
MMVVIHTVRGVGRAAQPVLRLPVARVHNISVAEFSETIQPAIHRRQTDAVTPATQLGIDVLRRAETIRLDQHGINGIGLARVTNTPSTRPARRPILPRYRHDRSSRPSPTTDRR